MTQFEKILVICVIILAIFCIFRLSFRPLDYEDVAFGAFLTEFQYYTDQKILGDVMWNDEVHPAWWKWPPRAGTIIFNGAPEACPIDRTCINVSVAAMSLFLRHGYSLAHDFQDVLLRERTDRTYEKWMGRPYTLCQLYTRKRPHREAIWNELSSTLNPHVSLCGNNGNTELIFEEATELLHQCRFVASIEAYNSTGYITEKILNSLLAGAIPIYWGSRDVHNLFNPSSLIFTGDYASLHWVAQHVSEILGDRDKVIRYMTAPIATEKTLRNLLWWRFPTSRVRYL